MNQLLRVQPHIRDALHDRQPVVALESSIIAHGMPYPANIETALACESLIRSRGAIPATIAVMNHKICVGLTSDEIEAFGRTNQTTTILKLSRKDLGYALAQGAIGATTVASTMIAAHACGIRLFATGGIGGVHRGAELSMDISADLNEFARTPVAVVCSGLKSILDIGLSLEVLETLGVPIIGFQTNEMPAFFCTKSGFLVDSRADEIKRIAEIIRSHWEIAKGTGIIIANPVPDDAALNEGQINQFIDAALIEATRKNIRGKAVTPFLLWSIAEQTGALSLRANIALVKSNAVLAAKIAVEQNKEYSSNQEGGGLR